MKIIEGLKRLKTLRKQIEDQCRKITEYSSKLSTEKAAFGTEDEQKKTVQALVQSNVDLVKEFMALKKRIETTNLTTMVNIGGVTASISDHLTMKRTCGALITQTYRAMNTSVADGKISTIANARLKDSGIAVERMFDEAQKNAAMKVNFDYLNAIEEQIEVINATTDLV